MNKFILVAVGVLLTTSLAQSQAPIAFEKVLADWKQRRKDAKPTRWELRVVTTRHKYTSEQSGIVLVPKDTTCEQKYTFLLAPEEGWFRLDVEGTEWSVFERAVKQMRGVSVYYNGECRSCRYPLVGTSDVVPGKAYIADFDIRKSRFSDNPFVPQLWPTLFEWGLVPVQTNHGFYSGQFHKYVPSDYADGLLPSQRKPDIGETWVQCGPLSDAHVDRLQEICVVTNKTSAVKKLERAIKSRRTGTIVRDLEVEVTYGALGAASFASGWKVRQFEGKTLVISTDVTVVKREVVQKPSGEDFQLEPRPGMVVAKLREGTTPSENPALDLYDTNSTGELELKGSTDDRSDSGWARIAILGLLLGAVFAVVGWYRWSRTRTTS